ncbi:EscU/YscU/HrcU family type III secretion system export apparatus switch protein [Frigidibacter oleivorans]|uniref:EscU/YscU/HrcU family type III secretion system export apparatus switch protein n=1 Tax=Frigidibacter oleivorans TaxID=2487129 RepID=UPI000F8C652C|nr:EscU/YscU/HrcU family type III secretion system export apparatus switch protein [Frigidibacter oleivorans]
MSTGAEEGAGERSHDPTPRRLEQARARGDVPRLPELAAAAGQAGLLATAALAGGPMLTTLGELGMMLLGRPDRLTDPALLSALLWRMLAVIAPLFLAPMAATLALLVLFRAIAIVPSRLQPDLGRLSPLAALGRRFGIAGLAEFASQAARLMLVSALCGWFLIAHLPGILMLQSADPRVAAARIAGLPLAFLAAALALNLCFGLIDMAVQRGERSRRLRMSRQDLVEEYRESEGDPHLKGRRLQRAREIATNRMLAEVPAADVVIVNPTHVAVALRWRRGSGRAPVCVAKGTDAVAARIRALALESGVPLRSDPPTARALHAAVEIGQEIRPEHYAAVAAAIRFAEEMRRRARARWG